MRVAGFVFGNSGERRAISGIGDRKERNVMRGDVAGGPTEISAGWRLSIACHRLSDYCHRLPKPAMTCHGVSDFLRRGGWLAFRPNGDLGDRGVSKLWVDSKFRQIDILKRQSVASDSSPENEGQGIWGPVTDCHIDFAESQDAIVARPFRALWFVWRPIPRALPWARRWAAPLVLRMGRLMETLMGRLMGNDAHGDPHGNGAHVWGADEAGTHEVSRSRASWPSRLFRPEGALYRSPGQRPGSHDLATPFPEPCRGDLGLRVANLGLDVSIVGRPFRALWFVWRPVPRALPWAAMDRTFGAQDRAVDGNAHGAADGGTHGAADGNCAQDGGR